MIYSIVRLSVASPGSKFAGSVWHDSAAAKTFLEYAGLSSKTFGVFEVDAEWSETDEVKTDEPQASIFTTWRVLRRDARLGRRVA